MGFVVTTVGDSVVDFPVIILVICALLNNPAAEGSVHGNILTGTCGLQDVRARYISLDTILVNWSYASDVTPTKSYDDSEASERRDVEIAITKVGDCNGSTQRHQVVALQRQFYRFRGIRGSTTVCVRLRNESLTFDWRIFTLHDGAHLPAQVTNTLSSSVIYTPGEKLQFTCHTSGYPAPTVRWYKDGTILMNDDHHYNISREGTLHVDSTDVSVDGAYECKASNVHGSAVSNQMELCRAVMHSFPPDEQQRKYRVAVGDGLLLECRAPFSVPSPVISWQRVTSEVDRSPRPVTLNERVTMATDGSLLFVMTEEEDEGLYQCHVANNYLDIGASGSISNLTLYGFGVRRRRYPPRRLYSSPQSGASVVLAGQTTRLQCVFSGRPDPTIVWYHEGRALSQSTSRRMSTANQVLTLTSVTWEDAGRYECEAYSQDIYSHRLEFRVLVHAPPTFIERPESQNVTIGDTVQLACRAAGTPPPEVVWFINGEKLSDKMVADRSSLSLTSDGQHLALHNVNTRNTASLHCQAANIHGIELASFYVNVYRPTRIVERPSDVVLGDRTLVIFPCSAETDPGSTLTFHWYRGQNSYPITMEKHRVYTDDDNSLVLNLTHEEDGGKSFISTYTCIATNGISSVNTSARLRPVMEEIDKLPGPAPVLGTANIPAVALYSVVSVGILCVLVTVVTMISYVRKRKQMRSRLDTGASEMSRLSTLSRRQDFEDEGSCAVGKFPIFVADESLRACVQDVYIERERLEIASLIGKGQFGRVYAAVLVDPRGKLREKVAVKTLKYKAEETEMVELFLREAMMMRDFRHLHVLSLIGITVDVDASPMVVLPFMANGDLRHYILNPVMDITVLELLKLGLQVARGMVYLSSMRFVHRDLAARNCMVDSDGLVRVADFGLSRELFKQDYYRIDNGKTPLPIRWMAPECLDHSVFTTMSDMWSMGVLLWELMTRGAVPYPDVDNWDIAAYIKSHRRLAQPAYCPTSVYTVMVRTWAEQPQDRPSFATLVSELEGILRTATQPKGHNTGPGPAAQATHLYANIVSPVSPMITDYRHTTV